MMFTRTTTTGMDMNESMDSKYTVADILSSMASGEALTPTYSGAIPTLASGLPTSVPLLTPTTLASLEQTFTELQSIPTTSACSSSSNLNPLNEIPSFNRNTESGFVPPVINMVKQEFDYGSDPEWTPPGFKRARVTTAAAIPQGVIRPTYATSVITSQSAAPVTPRRHTGPRAPRNDFNLTPEESRKRGVRRERNKMAAAKCRQRRVDLTNTLLSQTEELEDEQSALENDISSLQQQKEQLEFLLQAHKPLCHAKKNGQVPVVKTERPEMMVTSSAVVFPQSTFSTSTTRPNTLSLPLRTTVTRSPVTEALGVSITTPSSGVIFNFGLESMMDGHTGLTPLTGGPSCASQVQRSSSDSSPSDALSSPTTLMAL